MTENQTNQHSQPANSGGGNAAHPEGQRVPGTFRKTRPGHFASDSNVSHRDAPTQPKPIPTEPVATVPEASAVTAPRRFEAGSRQPASSAQPTQPKQMAQRPAAAATHAKPTRLPIDAPFERTRLLLLALILTPLCIYGSLPSWASMVYEWWNTDDYSHGFIVIPVTLLFLYLRLDTYPGTTYKLDWVGLFPILIYGVLRFFAGEQFMAALDAVAIWFWILGVVWFFYGWRAFLWALPSLCFLVFMFQLPYSVDMMLRGELQQFAAKFAAAILQTVGVAAIPITNTIRLSTMELGVEAACSGLRFLMSIFAIAFATVLLMRRPWWQNVIILAIAAPLALFVNAVRIAITGVLLENYYDMVAAWTAEGQSVSVVADVQAGRITIFLALGLFALFVWFLGKIFRRVEI